MHFYAWGWNVRTMILSLVIAFVQASSALAQPSLAQPSPLFFRTDYLVNGYLDYLTPGLVVADFNNDGKPDFAVGSRFGITVGLGKGDGTFQMLGSFSVGSLSSTLQLATNAFDMDADGNVDLILFAAQGSLNLGNGVVILPGNGDGTFGAPRMVAAPSSGAVLDGVRVADLNGDGHPDLVLLATNGNTFSNATATATVFLNSGKGTFSSSATLNFPSRQFQPGSVVAVGDFNHDGVPDLAMNVQGLFPNLVTPVNTYVTVCLGKGNGTFSAPTVILTLIQEGTGLVASADFNHDGVSDLAVEGVGTYILLGNGDGSFHGAPKVNQSSPVFLVADWTGSGNPGFAGFDLITGGLAILAGNGDGTFYSAGTIALSPSAQTDPFAVADLNGDGLPDVLTAVSGTPQTTTISVVLNAGPGPPLQFVVASAASGIGSVAPASLATIYAVLPFPIQAASSSPPVTVLGGLTVLVTDSAGQTRLAPLYYVSASQINLEIPTGTAPGVAKVSVMPSGPGATAVPFYGSALVSNTVPGIFTTLNVHLPAAYVVTYGPDNQPQPPVPVASCQGNNCSPVPIPRPSGSRVFLELFATGISNSTSPVMVSLSAGMPAQTVAPLYAGPQGQFEGLDQVNLEITDLPTNPPAPNAPPGTIYALALTVDGFASNIVEFSVQ